MTINLIYVYLKMLDVFYVSVKVLRKKSNFEKSYININSPNLNTLNFEICNKDHKN